ncbi:MAG: OmpA family protein [Actinomycetales bacterium]|nr:OmpA family protein [Actinomycetales bacterium]
MKKFTSLFVSSVLGLGLISLATPAQAVSPSVHTVTPTTQNPGREITVGANVPIPTIGESENVITHTWKPSDLAYVTATAPEGWLIEYKTADGWSTSLPSDLSTLEGIRTTGTINSRGVLNGKQELQTSAKSTLLAGPAGSYVNASRGDGWGAFTSAKYVLNVYHHDSDYRLECHLKSTGELCGDLYAVPSLATSQVSGGIVKNNKVFSYIVDNNYEGTVSVVCTDISALPFKSCGVYPFGEIYDANATRDLSSQAFDGRNIWVADFRSNRLLCFDTQAAAQCENQPAPFSTPLVKDAGSAPGYTTYLDGRVFVTAGAHIWCVNAATATECPYSWPATIASGGYAQSGVIPHVTGGVHDGVCVINGGYECFNFAGGSLSTPTGLQQLLSDPSTGLRGGSGYWQTTAWNGSKVIWPSNPNGSYWNEGYATCYDWSTDAACSGFDSTVKVGYKIYSFSLDDQNPTCVLANGDDGNIHAFDLNSGQLGCKDPETKAVFTAKAIAPSISCSSDGNIHAFNSVLLSAPDGLQLSDLRLTVQNSDQTDIQDFTNLVPDGTGKIDLSALSIDTASNDFRFIVSATGMTDDQARNVGATLLYTADLPELCVTLRVKPECPQTWPEGTTSLPQKSRAVSTTTSRTPTGGSAVTASQASSVAVLDAVEMDCKSFKDLTNEEGQGVNTGDGNSQVVAMAWAPDGTLYVGGVFQDAGGDPNADFLARWTGSKWEAVGPTGNVDDGFNPAINERVTALVFDKNGNLVVGGHFSNAGGIELADKVAIYNPTDNTWQAPGVTGSFSGNIRAMSMNPDTGKIVIAGLFSQVNGDSNLRGIVEMDPASSYSIASLNSDFGRYIHYAAFSPEKKLYAGGWFSVGDGGYGGAQYDGNSWSALPKNFNKNNDSVRALAWIGTKLYVGGNFNGIQVYDSEADTWSPLAGSNESVGAWTRSLLVSSTGDLYIGYGNMGNAKLTSGVVRYSNGEFIPLRDAATGSVAFDYSAKYGYWKGVWALGESPTHDIYIAGDFQNAGGNEKADYITAYTAAKVNSNVPTPSPTPSIKTQIVKPASGTELSMGTGSQTPSPANSPETETLGKVGPGEGVEFTSEFGAANNSPDAGFFNDVRLGSGVYNNHYVPFDYAQMIQFAPMVIGQAACQDFTFTYRIYPSGTDVSEITYADLSYLDTATVTVIGDPSICASPSPSPSASESASPSPSPSESESASPSPSPSASESASPTPTPSITPVPTSTKLPPRPEDKNLTGLVVKAETKIKEPSIDVPAPAVVVAAKSLVDLAPAVSTAYKVHGNDADRGLVTIPTNTVIQADTSLFKQGDVVNAYLQSPNGIYFSLGENISLDGPLVLQPMRFLKPGRYEIIVTQVAEVVHFKRHYVKAPTFGKKTTRIVVYVIPPKATVHFDFCKYNLSKKAKADLKELAVRLRGAGVVTIVGYTQTDLTSPASRAANKVLSVNRAKTVAAYLRKQGLHVRMIIVGKGATNPVSVEHQYKNRRVTITYGF